MLKRVIPHKNECAKCYVIIFNNMYLVSYTHFIMPLTFNKIIGSRILNLFLHWVLCIEACLSHLQHMVLDNDWHGLKYLNIINMYFTLFIRIFAPYSKIWKIKLKNSKNTKEKWNSFFYHFTSRKATIPLSRKWLL